jgi:hypothetical protein
MASDSGNKVIIDIVLDDGTVKQVFGRMERDAKKTGSTAGQNLSNGMRRGFTAIATAAAAAGAAVAAALTIGARAAMVQEDAVNSMNQSLANAGRFSQQASIDMQNFASELQKTTRIGDEQTLSLLALAGTFTKTNKETRDLTKAAVELSAATGMDLNSAIQNLGRTMTGELGRLGQQVPALRGLSKEALQSGEAIRTVSNLFSGSAAAAATTFSGRLEQMRNSFGDMLEEIGKIVTESQGFGDFVDLLKSGFEAAGKAIADNRVMLRRLFADGIIRVIAGFKALAESMDFVGKSADFMVATTLRQLKAMEIGILKLRNLMPGTNLNNEIELAAAAWREYVRIQKEAYTDDTIMASFAGMLGELEDKAREHFSNIGEEGRNALNFTNNPMAGGDAIAPAAPVDIESMFPGLRGTFSEVRMGFNGLGVNLDEIREKFGEDSKEMATALEEASKRVKQTSREMGQALFQGIGQGAGSAFAAMGKAIHDGTDMLKAFGDALLSAIGEASIQLGTNFILQGAAYTWAGMPNGPPLMAAGAALATFGGVLSAAGGGRPAVGSTSMNPGRTSAVDFGDDTDFDTEMQERRADTQISVNINGDVLDSDETGLRIVDILNRSFDKQGTTIKQGAFA